MEKVKDTRCNLLKAACTVFNEKGFEKAKVSDIVKMANVAQGTFYTYFKTKHECLHMLSKELMLKFLGDIKKEAETMDEGSIYRVVALVLDSIYSHKEVIRIFHFEQRYMNEELVELHNSIGTVTHGIINKAFLAAGHNERIATIKANLVKALIENILLNDVLVINKGLRFNNMDVRDMLNIVIDEVKV
jgi:AcrR family transcriptional regulator